MLSTAPEDLTSALRHVLEEPGDPSLSNLTTSGRRADSSNVRGWTIGPESALANACSRCQFCSKGPVILWMSEQSLS